MQNPSLCISSFSLYLPPTYLSREKLDALSGGKGGKGVRRICGVDEDLLTLVYEAGLPFSQYGGNVILGYPHLSLSHPWGERLVKTSLFWKGGLHREVGTPRDLWGSLGRRKTPALFVFAEERISLSDDPVASLFSDGSGGVCVEYGESGLVLKEQVEEDSLLPDFLFNGKTWSLDLSSAGLPQGVLDLFRQISRKIQVPYWFLSFPHPLWIQRLGAMIRSEKIFGTNFSEGYFGSVDPLVLFSRYMKDIPIGESFALVVWGGGILIQVWEKRGEPVLHPFLYSNPVREVLPHQWWKWKGLLDGVKLEGPFLTLPMVGKEMTELWQRKGFRCSRCSSLTFPLGPACIVCGSEEGYPERISDTGEIFTYTIDYLNPSLDPPTTMIVGEMEGGGRVYLQGTGDLAHKVEIGNRFRMTLRVLHYGSDGKTPVYFWKARGDIKKKEE